MELKKLLWGSDHPNEAQIKFYSSTIGNLGQAAFLASSGLVFLSQEGIVLGVLGLVVAVILLATAARILKGVKDV